ncbi:MAG: hypothetical protein AB1758_21250, partial [Candidatus Eremiobacterota bacterium]
MIDHEIWMRREDRKRELETRFSMAADLLIAHGDLEGFAAALKPACRPDRFLDLLATHALIRHLLQQPHPGRISLLDRLRTGPIDASTADLLLYVGA